LSEKEKISSILMNRIILGVARSHRNFNRSTGHRFSLYRDGRFRSPKGSLSTGRQVIDVRDAGVHDPVHYVDAGARSQQGDLKIRIIGEDRWWGVSSALNRYGEKKEVIDVSGFGRDL
jgi:hypothetical protein